jgi:hypothetical protein
MILLVFVLGLYSTYERKHANFCFLNTANMASKEIYCLCPYISVHSLLFPAQVSKPKHTSDI